MIADLSWESPHELLAKVRMAANSVALPTWADAMDWDWAGKPWNTDGTLTVHLNCYCEITDQIVSRDASWTAAQLRTSSVRSLHSDMTEALISPPMPAHVEEWPSDAPDLITGYGTDGDT